MVAISLRYFPMFGLASLFLCNALPAFSQDIVSVPSDARAKYKVLDLHKVRPGLVSITTQRDGPSGTSFAKREVDCRAKRFRYVGEGDTLEEMQRARPNGNFSKLVSGSISQVISSHACAKAK